MINWSSEGVGTSIKAQALSFCWCEAFRWVQWNNLSRRFTSRSDHAIRSNTLQKNPRATAQILQASTSILNVKAHNSTIRKRQNKYSMFGRVARKKPCLSKKKLAARLRFVKLHRNKPQDFWNNVFWTEKTKAEMSGHNACSWKQSWTIVFRLV